MVMNHDQASTTYAGVFKLSAAATHQGPRQQPVAYRSMLLLGQLASPLLLNCSSDLSLAAEDLFDACRQTWPNCPAALLFRPWRAVQALPLPDSVRLADVSWVVLCSASCGKDVEDELDRRWHLPPGTIRLARKPAFDELRNWVPLHDVPRLTHQAVESLRQELQEPNAKLQEHELTVNGKRVKLSPTQAVCMRYLLTLPNRSCTRADFDHMKLKNPAKLICDLRKRLARARIQALIVHRDGDYFLAGELR